MALNEETNLLKAVLTLAMVDGKMSAAEKGIIGSLAARIGVGQVSLAAMIDRATRDPHSVDDLRIADPQKARQALELLVAQARIDGDISDAERALLVRIAQALQVPTEEFGDIYRSGIARADRLRRERGNTETS